MKSLKFCFCLTLAFISPLFIFADNRPADAPFDPTSGVTRVVLSNGLTVLVKERHDRPIVTTWMAYRVAIRNEQIGLTGLSHYLEHMQFKGTSKLKKGDIDLVTLKNGGVNNAFTSSDYTCFWFKFASDRWEAALEIEADRVRNSTFLQEEFAPEKQVVIEELQGGEDGPWETLSEQVWATAFTQHPYHAPIIGWFQDVKRATRDDMKAYYDKWYHPRNATLIIVGDVNTKDVLAKVEKLFGKIPTGPEPPPQRVVEPPQHGERRLIVKKSTPLERLLFAFHVPETAHADSYPLEIAQVLLGSGKTSRLWQRLMEKDQSVTEFGASYDERFDPSLFSFSAELKPGNKLADVERAMEEEIAKLDAAPVAPEELARAKQLIESSFIMGCEDIMGEAGLLASAEMLAAHPSVPEDQRGYRYLTHYLERVRAVTAADVQRVAKTYFRPDNRTVGYLLNEDSAEKAKPEGSNFGDASPSSKSKHSFSKGEARKVSPSAVKLLVERFVLPNGAIVLLSENHTTPTVSLAASVKAGSRYEKDEEAGLAQLVGDMLDEGTERRTSQQIAEAIESVGGEFSSGGGYSRSNVNARVLSRDFDLALDLVSDSLMRANFPEERAKQIIDRRVSEIQSRADSPGTVASDLFNEVVYAGHPAHRPSIGYEATVKKLTREQLVTFYKRFFRPDNTLLAVVGDFDAKAARAKIEKAFADWKAEGKFSPPEILEIARQKKAVEKTATVDKEQVNVYMGNLGIKRDNPDFYAVQVLDTVLGSSPGFTSRMPRILRDEQGLAYSAWSNCSGSAGIDPGRFVAFIGCSPENAQKALNGMRHEIERIVKEPVSAQEIDDAKAYLTGSFLLGLETNGEIAGFLLNAEIFGLGFDFPQKYPALIEVVKAEDVARVAKKYISPEAMTTVIVGPKAEK